MLDYQGNYVEFDMKEGEDPLVAMKRNIIEKRNCACAGHEGSCHCSQCCTAHCICHSRIPVKTIVTKEFASKFSSEDELWGFLHEQNRGREDTYAVYEIEE